MFRNLYSVNIFMGNIGFIGKSFLSSNIGVYNYRGIHS